MKLSKDLTRGSIPGLLFKLSGPIVFSMVMHTLYVMGDLYFIGRLGPDAVAAISISGNAFFFVFGLSFVIGTGGMALIAQSFGRRDYKYAGRIFQQSLMLGVLIGVCVSALGLAVAHPYIKFFGGTGRSLEWGVRYFSIYSISFPVLLLLFVFGSCFRGMGNTRTPMFIMIQSTIINLGLDPILIFGLFGIPALGVQGAAIASLIAQVYSISIYGVKILSKGFDLDIRGPWIPDMRIIRMIFSIGVPAGLTYFLLAFNMLITYRVVSVYGTPALASLGIGFRILQAVYLPAVAVSSAMATMTGQNFGAGNISRILKTFWNGWGLSSGIMIVGTVLCWTCPDILVGIFNDDPGVIHYGTVYITIMSLGNIAVGTIMALSAVFQGLGKTYPAFIAAIIDNSLFAALVFTLPAWFGWSIDSVWWIKLVTAFIEMLLCAIWLRYDLVRLAAGNRIRGTEGIV